MAAKAGYMDTPVELLTTNKDGKWEVSQKAVDILSTIEQPIAVVSVVGKYRTGKSYLMNKLAGCNSGFNLGSTIQSETKGIWMWARPHPQNRNQCLLILDTEGLYDVEKGDPTHDMHLFIFAVLLSNCMVFNTVGSVDNVFVQELHTSLVAELTEKIRVKKMTEGGGDEDEEDGIHFSTYFPALFVVLRDFFLELKINGRQVTSDEYLEHSLTPKKGMTKKNQEYNAPRECIMQFFKKRRCFALPKPVRDDGLLTKLEKVEDRELIPDFVKKCQEAIKEIIAEAKPMTMNGNQLCGTAYIHIVEEYAKNINEGGVPCIESAIDSMIEGECRKAYEKALQFYKESMSGETDRNMPMDTRALEELNAKYRPQAVDVFRRKSMFEDKGPYAEKLEELNQAIENEFNLFVDENNKRSEAKAVEALNTCFAELEREIPSFSSMKGGHAKFVLARDSAIARYQGMRELGPMGEKVLHEYLSSKQDTERAIITADNALTEKEKEEAMLKKEIKEREEKIMFEQEQRRIMDENHRRQQQQQMEVMQKMQTDMQENINKRMKEEAEARKQMERDHQAMLDKQLDRQARQFKETMEAREKDSKAREEEARRRDESMTTMLNEFKEMNMRMQERDEQYRREMVEMRQEMQEKEEREKDRILAEMEEKQRQHELEKERLKAEVEKAKLEKEKEPKKGTFSLIRIFPFFRPLFNN